MIRLGILGSTRGTNMLALIEAIKKKQLDASIEIVISNKKGALILTRAKTHDLRSQYIPVNGMERTSYDMEVSQVLKAYDIDLIVLIGYMRILSARFVNEWHNKIINIHPSLLPAYAGKMDLEIHQAVIEAQEKKTGCTVHFVTETVDAGPIILQKTCPILTEDTAESLKARVQALEAGALIEAITNLNSR
ncbi:phosphoribosylglycinamide formyltransferase [Legionella israelensis]|uniref:Phosphoribosylglycinamide formyltransferase n=1 Tax=Legionella israelensis TaxID=454 RepID=A0A0W0VL03_9GAMM|nr:phosphoribosylglycinamide formyltransferase [Legionella israelensis]KTD20779.1 phosphoribosylglycinamide formyltransferase [Legionella israelensis]QBS10989.1 phosphoribosylglycinamide formyltransferase [Legionella israelensis]SCY06311.1 formyltetrahydrofolate-dependent phosphoribosylglycinamide formyltransferase [Legionella israelensis DSM 19235]STX57983.1 phosphoribosylglycinamide formyltransferase 1 [Legionella israelensis]